jgi:sugar O-acyltransferase (sialic acid O-acetyltransferase NeuD family)
MIQRKIGLIGYGIIGQEVESFISEDPAVKKTDFFYFDDLLYQKGLSNTFRFSDFDSNRFSDLEFYICLGYSNPAKKKEICEQLEKNHFSFPPLIHKTVYIHPSASIGKGTLIYPMCSIGLGVHISDGVIINVSSVIGHGSFIDKYTFIAANVTLSGDLQVGQNCFAGSGTVIANNLRIGNNVKMGIGTVVTKNIDDNLSVIGNPFKVVSRLDIK